MTFAPRDVPVSAQNTELGPEKTPSFQALSIPTKNSRDTIEILNGLRLIKENDEVGASENTSESVGHMFQFQMVK